jgi:transposase-like protein
MPTYKYVNFCWGDTKAASLNPVGRLIYHSNLLGTDQRITNTGGGNTSAKITELRDRKLEQHEFIGLMLDGVWLGQNAVGVVALGITRAEDKVVLDGSAPLASAVRVSWPEALIQRCVVHKERNLFGYLRKADHPETKRLWQRLRLAEGAQACREALAALRAFLASRSAAATASLDEAGESAHHPALAQRAIEPQSPAAVHQRH